MTTPSLPTPPPFSDTARTCASCAAPVPVVALLLVPLALDVLAATVLGLAILVAVALVRRQRADRALAALAGRGYSAWLDGEVGATADPAGGDGAFMLSTVFWGRLHARERGGFDLAFDRPYALPGRVHRRRALSVDGGARLGATVLVRAHTDADLSARLVRDEAVRTARGVGRGTRGLRATWNAALARCDRLLGGDACAQPVQDAGWTSSWIGERVHLRTLDGLDLAGRVVALGRRWVALVDDAPRPDVRAFVCSSDAHEPHPSGVAVTTDDGIAVTGAREPVVIETVTVDTVTLDTVTAGARTIETPLAERASTPSLGAPRVWRLDVVLLPGRTLRLPSPHGAHDAGVRLVARAHVRTVAGLDLVVPRSSARIVFAGDEDATAGNAPESDPEEAAS